MKAEINNENKAKFFVQYWGQEVFFEYFINRGLPVNEYCPWDSLEHRHLELKPLSSISDEDAIEVAKILDPNKLEGEWTEILKYKSVFTNLINTENESEGLTHVSILHVFDFLRACGYLVPWMGLSPEEIIEAGWAKYKE